MSSYDEIRRITHGGAMEKHDRTEVIMVRVSAQNKRAFEEAAENLDMKVSEFLLAAALLYLAITVNPHSLKSLVKGAAASVRETMAKLRAPGLRKTFWAGKNSK
jgi:uncharacterized protein (DUF1778 family)